jgi:biotin operon repressor
MTQILTQKQRILNQLQTGQWISSVEATRDMYIMRLGARIWDLRAEGYQIEERRVEGKSYSEYRLRPAAPIVLPPAFPKPKVENRVRLF